MKNLLIILTIFFVIASAFHVEISLSPFNISINWMLIIANSAFYLALIILIKRVFKMGYNKGVEDSIETVKRYANTRK